MDLSSALATRPCALIAHTLGVESAPLATIIAQAIIAQSIIGTSPQKAYIYTWAPAETKDAHLIYQRYSAQDILPTLKRSIVIFDNAEQTTALIGQHQLKLLLVQENIVIILLNLLTPPATLVVLREALPGALLAKASFADYGQDIGFDVHVSKMSEVQDLAYQLAASGGSEKKGTKALKLENIAYPLEVQKLLEESKTPPSMKTLVERYREKILELSPKLQDLLLTIVLNRNQRHVVFTRYRRYYGAAMVSEILQLYGLRVFTLTSDLTTDQRKDVIRTFNASSSEGGGSILVTGVVFPPSDGVKNVHHLHMLDGAFDTLSSLLNSLYKYANYTTLPPKLVIHFYVCQRTSGADTKGAISYRKASEKWTKHFTYWQQISKTALPLVLNEKGQIQLLKT